ncbi:MAG: tetratricopeptide repeat protein [Deltaproteobacteria bacterium]|nr:tetratricopeptide repeat protein [Deltaproteobacteria bacterium]
MAFVVAALFLNACQHTPSVQDQKEASAGYRVAIEMVSSAQKAQTNGEDARADQQYRNALKELLVANETDPDNWEVHFLLSTVYLLAFARLDEAVVHARAAIDAREKREGEPYPEARQLLGSILMAQNKAAEAIPHFEKARTNLLYTTPFLAEQEIGWAYFKTGDTERARLHLNRAIAIRPKLCGAYIKLSDVEAAANDNEKSLAALNAFIQECDTEDIRKHVGKELLSFAYYRKGMALLKSNDNARALAAFEVCTARFSTSSHSPKCQKAARLVP